MSAEAKKAVDRIVLQTTVTAGVLGVGLSPVPLADEILLVPIYAVMTARIGRARGVDLRAIPWRPVGAAILAGLAARAAANVSFALIPGVAAVANCVSAVALTKLLGGYVDSAVQDPNTPLPNPFRKAGRDVEPGRGSPNPQPA